MVAFLVRKGRIQELRWSVVSRVQVSWVQVEHAVGGLRAKMMRRPEVRVACRAWEAWAVV